VTGVGDHQSRRVAPRVLERLLPAIAGVGLLVGIGLILRRLTAGLGSWDLRTLTQIARWRGGPAVDLAHVASFFGRSWMVVVIAAGAGWLLRRGGRGTTPLTAALMAIAAQNVVKVIVRRRRPPLHHLEHVTSWSFPSGHAAESTALLVGVAIACWPLVDSRWRRAGVLVAATAAEFAIAGSRLVLGVHYPTDVIAGVVLGAVSAALASIRAGRLADPRRWGHAPERGRCPQTPGESRHQGNNFSRN
jgi:membrane-associated phospholipid phosphatase